MISIRQVLEALMKITQYNKGDMVIQFQLFPSRSASRMKQLTSKCSTRYSKWIVYTLLSRNITHLIDF